MASDFFNLKKRSGKKSEKFLIKVTTTTINKIVYLQSHWLVIVRGMHTWEGTHVSATRRNFNILSEPIICR